MSKRMRLDCAQAFRASCEKLTLARREVFFRLAEPPDKMDFHFISPCGAKLYEVTEVKMEQNELQRTLMAILFAAGEPVAASRLSETLAVDVAQIHEEMKYLMNELAYHRSGIRIVRLEDAYQMCSAAEQAEFVTRTLETRRESRRSCQVRSSRRSASSPITSLRRRPMSSRFGALTADTPSARC